MNKEFVRYNQALALKELGFDEPCLAHLIGFGDGTKENGRYKINQQQVFYPNDYTKSDDKAEELGLYPFGICGVPLKQQVFRWFREKYQLQHNITWNKFYEKTPQQWEVRKQWIDEPIIPYGYGGMSKTYEEAESACIDKLIELIKTEI